MPTEERTKEPSSVVETQNPVFDGSHLEERSVRSVSLTTGSGSLRSSTTVASSETQHTCPNCHKVVEILPATPHRFPTDFCRCNKPPGPSSSGAGAGASDEPISEATLQDAPPMVPDDDSTSRSGAQSLPSGNLPPADQLVEREEELPPPDRLPLRARIQRIQTKKWFLYFAVTAFVILGIIIIVIIISFYIKKYVSGSENENSKGVTIRGRARKN